jgi:hypothetical protein
MTRKRLFLLNAVIAGGYGIALLVATDPILDLYGIGVALALWGGDPIRPLQRVGLDRGGAQPAAGIGLRLVAVQQAEDHLGHASLRGDEEHRGDTVYGAAAGQPIDRLRVHELYTVDSASGTSATCRASSRGFSNRAPSQPGSPPIGRDQVALLLV